jgi:hypothetical protein
MADLEPDEAVAAAARWIATDPERHGALLPEVRCRFGITTPQAIEAIRLANTLRKGGANASGS